MQLGYGLLRFLPILLRLGPDFGVTFTIDLNVNRAGPAADWAIFDVRLVRACRQVQWNDDLFTTSITDVAGFLLVCRLIDI